MKIRKAFLLFTHLLLSLSLSAANFTALTNNDTTLSGNINITSDLIIEKNQQLTILPGSKVFLKAGANIILKDSSVINIIGTADSLITFICSNEGEMWGSINARDTASQININYADIQNGQVKAMAKTTLIIQNSFIHQYYRGPNAIVYTEDADSLYINNLHVSNYYELNFVRTKCLVENSLFEYMIGDAIDFDNSPPGTILRNTTIRHGVGDNIDAVDFGKVNFTGNGSIGLVEKCTIYDISDKGISVGEGAQMITIHSNVIYHTGKGVAVKDNSTAVLINNTIFQCESGIEAVEKNPGLGGGNAYCLRNIIWKCDSSILINSTGNCNADTCLIGGFGLYPGNNNINTDPLFVDELNFNFNLQNNSPAKAPAAGQIDLGALFPLYQSDIDSNYFMLGSPRSGEILNGDSVLNIHWTSGSNIDSIKIEFYNSTINQWEILYNAVDAKQGYATWQLPNIYSTLCKLKLTCINDSSLVSETYGSFTILPYDTNRATKPLFSMSGGFYTNSLTIAMAADPGAIIYYTTDGSEPSDKSLIYTAPINISEINIPNTYSEVNITSTTKPEFPLSYIRTSPTSHIGPNPCLWVAPTGNIFGSTPIRAIAYLPGKKLSSIETNTYFINANMLSKYSVPVISLTTNKENLFDYYKGIFIPGDKFTGYAFTGNYEQRGRDFEMPFYMEMFEPNGTKTISQNIGIRVKGEWIRNLGQKSLGLYARSEYDNSNEFTYNLFPNLNKDQSIIAQNRFKRITLRNSGNEFPWQWNNSLIRDSYSHRLLDGLNIKNQANRPVVVFINGEYWGLHNLTEDNDTRSIENNYFLNPDSVVIMEHNLSGKNKIADGAFGDDQPYLDLLTFIYNNPLSDSSNYLQTLNWIDHKSLIDLWAANIFTCKVNYDHNTTFWRYKGIPNNTSYGADGRWRWIANDFDISFSNIFSRTIDMVNIALTTSPEYLISDYLKNPQFKKEFISRFADLLNSHFRPTETLKQLNKITNEYRPLVQEHAYRWNSPAHSYYWETEIDSIAEIALISYNKSFEHLMVNFSLDTSRITLNISDVNAGKIILNSLVIDSTTKGLADPSNPYPWNGTYFKEVPVSLTAIANPGYKFIKWLENNNTSASITVTLSADSTYTALFEVDTTTNISTHHLFINEVMSNNLNTYFDEYNNADDWIEIYNGSTDTIDLAGYVFSDGFTSCMIPYLKDSTKIQPNGFKVLWADDQREQGCLHLNFKLTSTGEKIYMIKPDRKTIEDSLSFGMILQSNSYGRFEDGKNTWVVFDEPTPNSTNSPNSVSNTPLSEIKIYPNPAKNYCFLKLNESSCYNVSVYDLSARNVLTKNECSDLIQLDLSKLNNGIYIIKATNGLTTYKTKIIKH